VLENHPILHYVVVLMFYNIGQAFNVLAGAYIASRSSLNSIRTIWQFFVVRWVPIGIRWFLCLCLFFVVWGNPKLLNLEQYMPTFPIHLGVAGMLGWVSDSVWDKVLALLLPGIQKELPAIPSPEETKPR
jgi:hypothetical protein